MPSRRPKSTVTVRTRGAFLRALLTLKPGDRIIYHTGMLIRDRIKHNTISQCAKAAWRSYLDGQVTLVQRKIDWVHGAYEYLAVKL